MSVDCFLLKPTGRMRVYLRRYHGSEDCRCTGLYSYHNAMVHIGEAMENRDAHGVQKMPSLEGYMDDPRWPVKCDHCEYQFVVTDRNDHDQVFVKSLYAREDNGAEMILNDAPPGAMWNAEHRADFWHGADGQCLHVRLPDGGDWMIDGRASNCDSPCADCGRPYNQHAQRGACVNCNRPYENCRGTCDAGYVDSLCKGYRDARPHKCWVREGVPPRLTVGKNGVTCGAGAGSILTPKWHGFLRDGKLVQ